MSFPLVATIGQQFSLFIKESYLILGLNRVALFSIVFYTINEIPTEFFFLPGFRYVFFSSIRWVVSASGLILLKGQASADIHPAAHVALVIIIVARRDDRSVRFQAYRVCFARRDSDDIPPAAHVASAILIPARRGNRSVRF